MPTPVIPPKFRIILFSHIVNVQEFRNTFYYETNWANLGGQADRIAAYNWVLSGPANAVTSAVNFYQHSWEYLDTDGEWQPLAIEPSNTNGQRTTPYLPLTVALVIIGKTAKRRTFGRKFCGPLAVADQSAGVPTAALLTAVDTFRQRWTQTCVVGSGSMYPCCWTKLNGFTRLTNAVFSPILGSQHNRKIGQGI